MIDWLSDNSYFMKDSLWNVVDAFELVFDLLNDSLIIVQLNQVKNKYSWENQIELIDLLKWIKDESFFYLLNQWSVAFHDNSDKKTITETEYRIC